MTRAKGIPNRPKELLDPQLAKLAAIVTDPNQDEETRRAAAKALQDAMEPQAEPTPTPQRKGFVDITTNKWMCSCDWFSAEGPCADCRAEIAEAKNSPVQPVHVPQAAPQSVPQTDTDLGTDLDELERELLAMGDPS
jgi:hypothetical protein